MIFTLYYAYATVLQWWRLRCLARKLGDTLNCQNALLVCPTKLVHDAKKKRSVENLLFYNDNRVICTLVPMKKINLSQWIPFPKNPRFFPIYLEAPTVACCRSGDRCFFVVLQALLDTYKKHQSDVIQVENYGELIGWRAADSMEIVLKANLDCLTRLIQKFSAGEVDINHELRLLKIETVDVEGVPAPIHYDKQYPRKQTVKYSYAPVHWNRFVAEIKHLYSSKVRDIATPRIKIENGSTRFYDGSPTTPPNSVTTTSTTAKNKTSRCSGSGKRGAHLDVLPPGTGARKPKSTSKKSKTTTIKAQSSETELVQAAANVARTKRRVSRDKVLVRHKKSLEVDELSEVMIDDSRKVAKPPNVLVYSDSLATRDNVKRLLGSILNKERYTIYDLPMTRKEEYWGSSTVLVVVCGSVPPDLTSLLIDYYLHGGQLLCICSDLMHSILATFTTAEVREHELVRFSYGKWHSVRMMHHIFCYQASPAKKQFSKDSSDHNSTNGSSGPVSPVVVAPPPPPRPTRVEFRHNDRSYGVEVQVLGTEETWHTPSLLFARVEGGGGGRAVFSQVHLEIDPEDYPGEGCEDDVESLRTSNGARVEILRDILRSRLDLDCDDDGGGVEYVAGYFLGRFDEKGNLLSNCPSIANNHLITDKLTLEFRPKNTPPPGPPSNTYLPVFIHSCPSHFSTLDYFELLSTESIGRLVIYSDVMTSSQLIVAKKLTHGLAVIPRRQTNGVGRSNNVWLSPEGCAAFSLQMHVPLQSNMGEVLPLIQHLVIVAAVTAVKNSRGGCEGLRLGIKWPNDFYSEGQKIGGVVVGSTILGDVAVVNIGCGVNLSNSNPTTCINDLISALPVVSDPIKPIKFEEYFARVFNEIERLYVRVQTEGVGFLFDLYYENWLHGDAHVQIADESGRSKSARVVGIDKYGFLTVRLEEDGTVTSVQPDGNSFDMMRGLIAPKVF